MRLVWLELRDFRNHAHTSIERVPDGLIVVVGANGEGKTNLLEGMNILYALGSPRVATNEALVREGAGSAYARGEFETRNGRALVEVEVPRRGAMKIKLNRSPTRRRRDVRQEVRTVLCGPFDLPIVIGDPGKRRDFVDEAIVAMRPARDGLTTTYDRALRQRNRLLKEWDRPGEPADIAAWDDQLVNAGVALIRARREAVEAFGPGASREFQELAGYDLEIRYLPNVHGLGDAHEEAFRERLRERRADELQRRTSLVGPHRDDLELAVRDLGARRFGSHGETWAAMLCLRLGLASALEIQLAEPPLLLMDDPFSALDPGRRDQVAARLAARSGQVIVSVADEVDIPAGAAAVWDVRAGRVSDRGMG